MRRRLDGSITVFLSFVLFLVLSLVLVSLESARRQVAAAVLQVSLTQALESTLGEYYAPLYDQFDIFALYGVAPESRVEEYLKATALPTSNLPSGYTGETKSGYSYEYELAEVTLSKTTRLIDGGGALCKKQMVEAGLYGGVEALAEELLDAVGLLESSDATLSVLEEKLQVEEQLSRIDELLLQLMPHLDGVATGEKGVLFLSDGTIQTTSTFAKQLVPGDATQEAVLMNNGAFYRKLQSRYLNGNACIDELLRTIAGTESAEDKLPKLQGQQARLRAVVAGTLSSISEAQKVLSEISAIQKTVAPMVDSFESLVGTLSGLLDAEMQQTLKEGIDRMRGYVGKESSGIEYDFEEMSNRLESNRKILMQMQTRFVPAMEGITLSDWRIAYEAMQTDFRDYSLEGLQLDYQYIKAATATEGSLAETIRDFVLDGMTSGLFPSDAVLSTRSIYGSMLPSDTMAGEESDLYVLEDWDDGTVVGWTLIKEVFGGGGLRRMLDALADGAEALAEKLLLLAYIEEHFACYQDVPDRGALFYQKEYLAFGSLYDKSNVESAALSIFGIRVLMNLIHTFTSAEKTLEATECATAILGSFGLPFLVAAGTYVILFVWALQNAGVETAALLQGRKVPFVVTGASFAVDFAEVFALGKEARLRKAAAYNAISGLEYRHYLTLFLLFCDEDTLTARAMDMIQCDMRLYYDPEFDFVKCIYGFGIQATASLPAQYTTVSFGQFAPQSKRTHALSARGAVSY